MHHGVPLYRLTAWLMLPLTLLLIAAAVLLAVQAKRTSEQRVRLQLEILAEGLALAASDSAAVPLAEVAGRHDLDRVWFVEAGRRIVASNRTAEVGGTLDPRWSTLLESTPGGRVVEPVAWGARVLWFAAVQNPRTGQWAVVLRDDLARREAVGWQIARIGLAGLGVWLLCAGLCFAVVTYLFHRPVGELVDVARRVANGQIVPEATLQRVHATTERSLGGLSDLVVDQAREQTAFQESVQEAAALYVALFDLMPVPALICSLDGQLLEANRAFCRRLGLSRPSILGRPVIAFKMLLPVEALMKLGQRSRDEQCAFDRLDFTFRRPDGREVPVVAAVQALRFQDMDAFVVVAEDRSEVRDLHHKLASFHDTVELMVDERAAHVAQRAAQLEQGVEEVASSLRALREAMDALTRLAAVLEASDEQERGASLALLHRAGQRLLQRLQTVEARLAEVRQAPAAEPAETSDTRAAGDTDDGVPEETGEMGPAGVEASDGEPASPGSEAAMGDERAGEPSDVEDSAARQGSAA